MSLPYNPLRPYNYKPADPPSGMELLASAPAEKTFNELRTNNPHPQPPAPVAREQGIGGMGV